MSPEFYNEIKEHFTDWMHDNEGNTYECDEIGMHSTMNENMDGCWIVYTGRALDFIAKHRYEAADAYDYYSEELDMHPNAFKNPEAYTFFMLDWGTSQMLADHPFFNEHWGERVTLDAATIAEIEKDL